MAKKSNLEKCGCPKGQRINGCEALHEYATHIVQPGDFLRKWPIINSDRHATAYYSDSATLDELLEILPMCVKIQVNCALGFVDVSREIIEDKLKGFKTSDYCKNNVYSVNVQVNKDKTIYLYFDAFQ